jgi:hypothetical protein
MQVIDERRVADHHAGPPIRQGTSAMILRFRPSSPTRAFTSPCSCRVGHALTVEQSLAMNLSMRYIRHCDTEGLED